MLKRKLIIVSILALFCFFTNDTYAYEFGEPANESLVLERINEIYDSKEQYEDLVGAYEEIAVETYDATSTAYWWPIGSKETNEVDGKLFANGDPETVLITSPFGYRNDPFGRGKKLHSGLDISGGSGLGSVNIIAARDGIVVYSTLDDGIICPSGNSLSNCGGGYGNYIKIQHSDGNYTLYAHMYENSLTLKSGESVKQGQVIGKMGSSGNSTGAHLHFEVRKGNETREDPLLYISAENPRIVFTGNEFLSWLNSWEGHTTIDGEFYVVENIGDGVRTVGGGITLENHVESFLSYGIDVKDYPVGTKIPIKIVDQMQMEDIAYRRSKIENILSQNSIELKENEIQALVSQMYNCGNISGFANAYKTYGNTQALYDNWFFRAIRKGSKFEIGLTRRRNSEWSLFHNGQYVYNG